MALRDGIKFPRLAVLQRPEEGRPGPPPAAASPQEDGRGGEGMRKERGGEERELEQAMIHLIRAAAANYDPSWS